MKIEAMTRLRAGRETGMGAGAIFYAADTGRFLLVKRSETCDYAGTWCGLGGGVEHGETLDEAVRREAWEEAKFPEDAICDLKYIGCQKQPDFEFHNYVAVLPKEFTPKLNSEHTDHRWADWRDFPANMHPNMMEALHSDAGQKVLWQHTNVGSRFGSESQPLAAFRIKSGEGMDSAEVKNIRDACFQLLDESRQLAVVDAFKAVVSAYNGTQFISLMRDDPSDLNDVVAFIKIMPKEPVGLAPFVNGVWASPELRGKGIGPILYALAIGLTGKLQSDSDNLGIMAVKTWQKLANQFTVGLYVRKARNYVPVDYTFGSDSIPIVNEKPITQTSSKFVFCATLKRN